MDKDEIIIGEIYVTEEEDKILPTYASYNIIPELADSIRSEENKDILERFLENVGELHNLINDVVIEYGKEQCNKKEKVLELK